MPTPTQPIRRKPGRPRKQTAADATNARRSAPPADPLAGKIVIRPNDAWPLLGIGPSLLWEMIADGRLRSTKIGDARLIFVSSIRELLEANATPS
jgi:hypothetical protein